MYRRHPKRRALPLPALRALLLLAAALPQPAPADDLSASARVFGEAMARMMDAMGLLGDGAVDTPAPVPGAMSGFGAPFGMGQMPWPGMPGAAMPDMGTWMQQMPGMMQLPHLPGWRRTTLDGIWEGPDGALFIVQAHRFRLYSSRGDYIDGLIQQRGDRVAMYDPEHDVARPYELAQHQGRLVLRDPEGHVYLYRRLWHDDIGYDTGGSGDGGAAAQR
jgi:hypothetical protein